MYRLPVLGVRDQNGGAGRIGSSWGLWGEALWRPLLPASSRHLPPWVCPVSTVCKHQSYWVRTDANDFTLTWLSLKDPISKWGHSMRYPRGWDFNIWIWGAHNLAQNSSCPPSIGDPILGSPILEGDWVSLNLMSGLYWAKASKVSVVGSSWWEDRELRISHIGRFYGSPAWKQSLLLALHRLELSVMADRWRVWINCVSRKERNGLWWLVR